MVIVLAVIVIPSGTPAAGLTDQGAVGIAMTTTDVAPSAVAPTTARPTSLGIYSLMTGRTIVLPILAADTIRAPANMAGAATTYPIIVTFQAFDTTRPSVAASGTSLASTMMAAIRGTPTTNGTNFFAITNTMYAFLIAFVLALTIAARRFTRRLRYVAPTTMSITASDALALGGPQAPHRYLTASPATPSDDMRTSSRTTLAASPA